MSSFAENPPRKKDEKTPSFVVPEQFGSGSRTPEFDAKMRSIEKKTAEENTEHHAFSNWKRMYVSMNMKRVREEIAQAEQSGDEKKVLDLEEQIRLMEQGEVRKDMVPEKYHKFIDPVARDQANYDEYADDHRDQRRAEELASLDDNASETNKADSLAQGHNNAEGAPTDNELLERIKKQYPDMSGEDQVAMLNRVRMGSEVLMSAVPEKKEQAEAVDNGKIDAEQPTGAKGPEDEWAAHFDKELMAEERAQADSTFNESVNELTDSLQEDGSKITEATEQRHFSSDEIAAMGNGHKTETVAPEKEVQTEKVYPESSEASKEKISDMALLRNDMKAKQADYDRKAQEYYATRGVGETMRSFIFDKLWGGSKIPKDLQESYQALEDAKNARREYAASMREGKSNAMKPQEMITFMRQYDRYTSDIQEFKDGNTNNEGGQFDNVRQAQEANRNWWNSMSQKEKLALGGAMLVGTTVATGGASLVSLAAAAGAVKVVDFLRKDRKANEIDDQNTELRRVKESDYGKINELLQKQTRNLDAIEANTLRFKIGVGVITGVAVGYSGAGSMAIDRFMDGWAHGPFGSAGVMDAGAVGLETPMNVDVGSLEAPVNVDATPMPQFTQDPLGYHAYVPGDNVYDVALEKVIQASPEMSHLSPTEQQNLVMNFIEKLRSDPDLSVALTGSESPDMVAAGDQVRLDSWRQLMMQDGAWSLDRAGDNVGSFDNMLEAADALDPNTNSSFEIPATPENVDPSGGEVFGEGVGDQADVPTHPDNLPHAAPESFVPELDNNPTWPELEAVLKSGTRVPYEQVSELVDGVGGKFSQMIGEFREQFNSPLYVQAMSDNNGLTITFNTEQAGWGKQLVLNTTQETIAVKSWWERIFGL